MTPEIERRLAEIAAEQSYTPGSEHMHALRLGYGVSAEQIGALQARAAELEKREAAYDIILKVVSNALERAGVTECDNPGDAIDMIAKDRDGLAAKCADLDFICGQFANMAFNLFQVDRCLSDSEKQTMKGLQIKYDAIRANRIEREGGV